VVQTCAHLCHHRHRDLMLVAKLAMPQCDNHQSPDLRSDEVETDIDPSLLSSHRPPPYRK